MKLREYIQSVDDLEVVMHEVPEWPHPDKPGEPVVLALKVPSLARRNELMRLFSRNRGTSPDGSMDPADMDWDGLAMGLLGEMVFDPDDMDAGPVFATEEDREIILNKNGRVCWDIMNRCLQVGGFQNADEGDQTPEEELVDAAKES